MHRKDILHRRRKAAARKAEKDAIKMQRDQPIYSGGSKLVMVGSTCYNPTPEQSRKKVDALPQNSRPCEYDNPYAFVPNRYGDYYMKAKGKYHTWARKGQSKKGSIKGRALDVYSGQALQRRSGAPRGSKSSRSIFFIYIIFII